jgi:two-component system, sensor histidine kinase ChiS
MRYPVQFFVGMLCWSLLGTVALSAQDLYYERLPAELGLSQNMINCILQDRTGFLWVGTNNGLNRYDGYRFTTFRYDPFDPLSIPGSSIHSLFEDRSGRLWITSERGICWFDPRKEAFYPLPVAVSTHSLTEDYWGNLWQGTAVHGMLCLLRQPATQPGQPDVFQPKGLDTAWSGFSFFSPIWTAPGLGFSFSQQKGALRVQYSPSNQQISIDKAIQQLLPEPALQPVVDLLTDMDSMSRHFLRGAERDRKGNVWISAKNTLIGWDVAGKSCTTIPVPDSFTNNYISAGKRWDVFSTLVRDRHDRLWLAGFNGTFQVDLGTQKIRPLYWDTNDNDHPLCYGVSSMTEDNAGLIWLGSRGKGVFKYNENAKRFAPGLWKGASIRTIYKTTDGLIWFGTPSNTLQCYNPRTKKTSDVAAGKRWSGREIGSVTSFHQDRKGALWVGSGNQGLLKITDWQKGAPYFQVFPLAPYLDAAPFMGPCSIWEDQDGTFWMSAQRGIIHFNPADGAYELIPFFGSDVAKIMENRFPVLFVDPRNQMWAGTSEGLWLFEKATKTFKRYQNDRANPRSLSHNLVKSIAADPVAPQRYLWVGTGGGGLSRLDMETDLFEHFTEKDGLPDMVVYSVLPDSLGLLWLSTNKGISVFDPARRSFRNFDQEDGLQHLEFNTLAFSRARDGAFLMGGIEGFNHFYPGQMLQTNQHVPALVFTDFKISGKSVSHKTPGSPLKESITYARRIILSHEVKVISFDFAALDFSSPAKNQFACKMEGFDKDWQSLGAVHSATYTNLSPGKYTFRVRGSNNDGVWNMEGISIEIEVLAPWWATWWAYTLYVLSISGIIFAFYQLQINRNKARAEALRLQELNNAKSLFLTTVSHELRTPLTSIMGFSKIIKKRMEERILPHLDRNDPRVDRAAEQVVGNLDIVVSESERLTALINNVLDLSKIESGKIHWQKQAVDIGMLIDRALLTVPALMLEKPLRLEKQVEPDLPQVLGDPDRLLQVLVNLLSNAVKFTEKGAISVQARRTTSEHPTYASAILVSVRDTGIGIPENLLHTVFDKFHQISNDVLTDKPQGSGLGLAICKEIIEHHEGRIWVESTPGAGSTFLFTLPVQNMPV